MIKSEWLPHALGCESFSHQFHQWTFVKIYGIVHFMCNLLYVHLSSIACLQIKKNPHLHIKEVAQFIVFFNFLYLCTFMYFWLCWGFVPVHVLSLVAVWGFLIEVAFLAAEHGFWTHGLSNCGAQAQLPGGTWNLPRPEIEPTSPALAGRFLTTGAPGKSCYKP